MDILAQARSLSIAGRTREAVALVERSAAEGDTEALFALANWRLFGLNGPRDLAASHDLLDRARALGHVEAARLKATLVGNGTGVPGDPDEAAAILRSIQGQDPYAALQLSFPERMRGPAEVDALEVETLSERPLIRCMRGLLLPEECRYVITLAEPQLQPSFVIHPETGRRIPHPVRTSTGMSFGPTAEDRVIHLINRRLARVTGTEVSWGEPLHVLRYELGQEYRPHLDALPGVDNQRLWTVLVYLNQGYEGGATRFDRMGLDFAGREGDALIFRNVDESGAGDPATQHAGLPVIKDVKWLATRWIRQGPYDPWSQASA